MDFLFGKKPDPIEQAKKVSELGSGALELRRSLW
jgi:hypothetical protein